MDAPGSRRSTPHCPTDDSASRADGVPSSTDRDAQAPEADGGASSDDAGQDEDVSEPTEAGDEGRQGDDSGSVDASPDASAHDSGTLSNCALPTETAKCDACSGKTCQNNGCYNGYVCNRKTTKCVSAADCH